MFANRESPYDGDVRERDVCRWPLTGAARDPVQERALRRLHGMVGEACCVTGSVRLAAHCDDDALFEANIAIPQSGVVSDRHISINECNTPPNAPFISIFVRRAASDDKSLHGAVRGSCMSVLGLNRNVDARVCARPHTFGRFVVRGFFAPPPSRPLFSPTYASHASGTSTVAAFSLLAAPC